LTPSRMDKILVGVGTVNWDGGRIPSTPGNSHRGLVACRAEGVAVGAGHSQPAAVRDAFRRRARSAQAAPGRHLRLRLASRTWHHQQHPHPALHQEVVVVVAARPVPRHLLLASWFTVCLSPTPCLLHSFLSFL